MTSFRDPFFRPTLLQFPDGGVLSIGTIRCEDDIHSGVYLGYKSAEEEKPSFEIVLPPKTVDVVISQLQNYSNQARFINGMKLLVYPEPYPETASRPKKQKTKKKKSANKTMELTEKG